VALKRYNDSKAYIKNKHCISKNCELYSQNRTKTSNLTQNSSFQSWCAEFYQYKDHKILITKETKTNKT